MDRLQLAATGFLLGDVPPGLSGLILAGIVAAAMSSLSSSLQCTGVLVGERPLRAYCRASEEGRSGTPRLSAPHLILGRCFGVLGPLYTTKKSPAFTLFGDIRRESLSNRRKRLRTRPRCGIASRVNRSYSPVAPRSESFKPDCEGSSDFCRVLRVLGRCLHQVCQPLSRQRHSGHRVRAVHCVVHLRQPAGGLSVRPVARAISRVRRHHCVRRHHWRHGARHLRRVA